MFFGRVRKRQEEMRKLRSAAVQEALNAARKLRDELEAKKAPEEKLTLPEKHVQEFLALSDAYNALPPNQDLEARYKVWQFLREKLGNSLEGDWRWDLVDSRDVVVFKVGD